MQDILALNELPMGQMGEVVSLTAPASAGAVSSSHSSAAGSASSNRDTVARSSRSCNLPLRNAVFISSLPIMV